MLFGVSADFMVSDAVKVLYRKDYEAINPVSVGRPGWAHVGWLQWRMSPTTGLELGLGFGAPFGESDELPYVPLVPVFKTPLSVWLWRILLLRVLLALRLCPSFRWYV